MDRAVRIAGMAFLFVLPAFAGAETISSRGEALISPCFACHGPVGRSPGTIPELESGEELVEEMMEFRSGEKRATVMDRISSGYTEEEIRLMGEWLEQAQGGQR